MSKLISIYVRDDETLNESLISSEFGKELKIFTDSQSMINTDKKEIDSVICNYFSKVSEDLHVTNNGKLIPSLMIFLIREIRSSGINNINFDLNLFSEIIDIFSPDSRSNKKERTKDKRKAVMDAAMLVFSKNGFHETHVDEIAELAGVAKGTVYRYFKSKEDILKEIIKANNEYLTDKLMEIFNRDGHMLELIKEAIEYYVEFFDSNRDLYRILTHSPWILKDISDHLYKNIISQLQIVRRRVFSLTREGIVKPTDFYTVFYGIFGFIDGVIQKWFRRNCEYSLKDELPVIIEVLFYGFIAEGERKEVFS
jgi:AcrR family transcriptional regulator